MNWLGKLLGLKSGDPVLIDGVSDHVASWIGEPTIFHERISFGLHLDIYWVPAADGRPFHTLVTSGMAEIPMKTPADKADLYAELVMFLPPDWPMQVVTSDRSAYWPIRIMKEIASYPHRHETWIGPGHTIQLGELAPGDTDFSSVLVCYPELLDEAGSTLRLSDGRDINFLGVVLLRPEEHEFDVEHRIAALFDLAESQGRIGELMVATPGRSSLILPNQSSSSI
jgi:hypothetical protein